MRAPFSANGKSYPAGTMFIPAKASTLPIVQKLASDKGLNFDVRPRAAVRRRDEAEAGAHRPLRSARRLDAPRLGPLAARTA